MYIVREVQDYWADYWADFFSQNLASPHKAAPAPATPVTSATPVTLAPSSQNAAPELTMDDQYFGQGEDDHDSLSTETQEDDNGFATLPET